MNASRGTGTLRRWRSVPAQAHDISPSRPAAADAPPAAYPGRRRVSFVSAGALSLARIVRAVAGGIALLIALAILLRVLNANPGSGAVKAIHDTANVFARPFSGMFKLHGVRLSFAVNWGIGLIVYLIAGSLIAGTVSRMAASARVRRG